MGNKGVDFISVQASGLKEINLTPFPKSTRTRILGFPISSSGRPID
jgi:hypothetical protein